MGNGPTNVISEAVSDVLIARCLRLPPDVDWEKIDSAEGDITSGDRSVYNVECSINGVIWNLYRDENGDLFVPSDYLSRPQTEVVAEVMKWTDDEHTDHLYRYLDMYYFSSSLSYVMDGQDPSWVELSQRKPAEEAADFLRWHLSDYPPFLGGTDIVELYSPYLGEDDFRALLKACDIRDEFDGELTVNSERWAIPEGGSWGPEIPEITTS